MDMNSFVDPTLMEAKQGLADLLKYSLIIVASVPVLCLYPFAQKYFVKGVMIGSVRDRRGQEWRNYDKYEFCFQRGL